MDHDQRFKTLIREFFGDFLRLFFRDWADQVDADAVEWLDQELFPDPPDGSRHAIDLAGRVPVEAEDAPPELTLLLVHIEIESPDRTTRLEPRMPYYYHFLRDKHQLPVLPIVIYLQVGLDGIGTATHSEQLLGLEINRFQYLYVGLPALDAVEYVEGDNWLGVALSALMKIPDDRVVWLGAEALRRLANSPCNDQQRFLLSDCVQAYLPVDDAQRSSLDSLLQTEPYNKVHAMNQTVYDKGLERGIEQGIERGIERGIEQGIERGIEQGIERGIEQGREQGRAAGELIGRVRTLQEILGRDVSSTDELSQLSPQKLRQLAAELKAALKPE